MQDLRSQPAQHLNTKRRRGPSRRAGIVIGAVAIGALAVIGFGQRSTLSAPAPVPAVTRAKPEALGEWERIMARIDENRMRAFMDDDTGSLVFADVFNSPIARQDYRIMQSLRTRHLRLDRNPLHVDGIEEEFLTMAGVVKRAGLLVTDHMDAYNYVDVNGAVVDARPGRGPKTWRIELRRTGNVGRWLLFSAVAVTSRSAASTPRGM